MTNSCFVNDANQDAELLKLIKDQNVIAFEVLYKSYWHPLLHFAYQYIDDEDSCKEIVQGLFVHLHVRHKSLNIKSAIRPYLYTSLRNRIFNFVRSRTVYQRHINLATNEISYANNDVEQFVEVNDLKKKIALCINQMPSKYRDVYTLHFYDRFTIKKIASILNRPADTVEKQLRNAKSILRNYLAINK